MRSRSSRSSARSTMAIMIRRSQGCGLGLGFLVATYTYTILLQQHPSCAFVLMPMKTKTFKAASTSISTSTSSVPTATSSIGGFDPAIRCRGSFVMTSKSSDDDDDEPLFYDDFADFIPGDGGGGAISIGIGMSIGGTGDLEANLPVEEEEKEEEPEPESESSEASSELTKMLQKSQMEEMERNERISRNWSQGNWKCRGFSLDSANFNIKVDVNANANANANAAGSTTENDVSVVEGEESTRALFNNRENKPTREDSSDRINTDTDTPPPIHVCQIAFDETSIGGRFGEIAEVIAVGRTDGTVFLVQLGSEYLTRFTAVPKLSLGKGGSGGDSDGEGEGEGVSVKIESEMINDKEMQERRASQISGIQDAKPLDIPNLDLDSSTETSEMKMPPFEIQCQFQAHEKNEPISALLYHDDTLYTGCTSGNIKMWKIDEYHDRMNVIPAHNLSVHKDKVVAMKTLSSKTNCRSSGSGSDSGVEVEVDVMSHDLLLSASLDGSFALWDKGGDLVYRCQMVDDDGLPTSITSADVDTSGDEHVIYFGLSSGHVVGYVASSLIGHASDGDVCPVPKHRFLAHDPSRQKKNGNSLSNASGVTALTFGGSGSMGPSMAGGRSSSVLVTGGADGVIKQWEMIKQHAVASGGGDDDESESTSDTSWKLQHWPLLPTQRMRERAHIFQGHDLSPITALVCQGGIGVAPKILSASEDGSLRVWDATKGGENYRMDGFDTAISSLCLDREVLVTDGMGEYVCVHDFDVSEEDEEGDFELDFDW